ncbi:MAG TPA: hypothetical protein VF188_13215 [Longimicrobiales bacterium]
MMTNSRTARRTDDRRLAGFGGPATLPAERRGSPIPLPGGAQAAAPTRAPYVPPRLEALGAWSALTLQQSVPIGPGNF